MTREEEIKNYAYNNCINDDIDDTSYSLIVETARWADETMIAKACDWLENNINDYIIIDDYLGKIQPKISSSMFDNFKKAMEE